MLLIYSQLGKWETNLYKSVFVLKAGHSGAVVTHLPSTSEICGSNPGPYVGNLVVAYQWLALYGTEP